MLHNFQDEEGLWLGNIISKIHINYKKLNMKVKVLLDILNSGSIVAKANKKVP